MKLARRSYAGWFIALTFFIAFVLTILPLPGWAQWYRPEWVVMLVVYWCLALPYQFGVGMAWCIGLLLDTLRFTLLGQYALALSVVAYLTVQLQLRIRLFPIWQQSVCVFLLIACSQLLIIWSRGFAGQPAMDWRYWLAGLTSMLLWPWFSGVLNHYKAQ